jgi:hypothetical protein
MSEFIQNNWFWIVVFGFFIWMHASGMGCGGHGGHGGHREKDDDRDGGRRRDTGESHQH